MRFSDEFIQRVRDGSDLVGIVGEYVQLKRRGRNFIGLCPFHNEKTPSFNVSPDTQLYHCFGCGAGGNVFNFVMEIERLSFGETVRKLAEKAGLPIEETELSPVERQQQERLQRLLAACDLATKYYHYLLGKGSEAELARVYLQKRQVAPQAIKAFALGYAKPDWDDLVQLLVSRGFTEDELSRTGLVLPRRNKGGYYDRFRNRLIFPIKDGQGRTVAFGARLLAGDGPKYLNSAETDLFKKGSQLYGLDLAKAALRQGEPAIITEGYMDVITLHSAGFTSAVASLGTALTEGQVRLLSRFTSRVLIAYDGDSAGTAATWRGLELISRYGLDVKVIDLPPQEDPDSLVRTQGVEAFQEAIANAVPLIDYKLDRTLVRFDLRETNGRVKAARAVLPILAEISGAVAQEAYLEQVARKIGISIGSLKKELLQYQRRLRSRNSSNRNILPESRNNIINLDNKGSSGLRPVSDGGSLAEITILKLLFSRPELISDFLAADGLRYITNSAIRQILLALIETASSDQPLDPAVLIDRLEEPEVKNIFAELNFSEDLLGCVENPHDCMVKLRTHYFQEELRDLIQNLVNIRSSGQVSDVNNLLLKYIHLYKDVQVSSGERGEQ